MHKRLTDVGQAGDDGNAGAGAFHKQARLVRRDGVKDRVSHLRGHGNDGILFQAGDSSHQIRAWVIWRIGVSAIRFLQRNAGRRPATGNGGGGRLIKPPEQGRTTGEVFGNLGPVRFSRHEESRRLVTVADRCMGRQG